ncbi:MAG TPA: PQQ-binding-like beta-propeller repeat protein [Blastocatellia bacterium]|nr:PQQ-binding-like beta-propeller repeat protein [Blastocatellia bacterium]
MKFQLNGIGDNYRFMTTLMAIFIALGAVAISVAARRKQVEPQSKGPEASTPGWLQWGGPSRDFKVATQGIKENWSSGAPKQLWSRPLGEGHSAILVEQGKLYTMYGNGNREVIISLDAETGKTLWEVPYETNTTGLDLSAGKGPHSTPLIVGDLIYAIGVKGMMSAVDKNKGRIVWKHDLWSEFGGLFNDRGYSSSPVAYRNTVIVPVGGGANQCLMAFDQRTGAVVWKNINFAPAHASPMIINVGGQDQIIHFGHDDVYGADATNGNLLWSHPHKTSWGLNISTPLWDPADGLLFVSSAYGTGSRVIRLTRSGDQTMATQVWANNRVRIHFGNAVRVGALAYGSSGDFGPAFFTAINVKDGTVAWQDRTLARASFLYADNKFVILDEDGELAIASPEQRGLKIHAKASVMKKLAWTVPTLSGTKLYLRDRGIIMALDLG